MPTRRKTQRTAKAQGRQFSEAQMNYIKAKAMLETVQAKGSSSKGELLEAQTGFATARFALLSWAEQELSDPKFETHRANLEQQSGMTVAQLFAGARKFPKLTEQLAEIVMKFDYMQ